MTEFYRRLREARKANSLTQEELAEKADISRGLVSRYESGAVIPTVDVLVSLANALDVSTDYLLGRLSYADQKNIPHSSCTNEALKNENRKNDIPQDKEELRQFILDVLKDCIHLDS